MKRMVLVATLLAAALAVAQTAQASTIRMRVFAGTWTTGAFPGVTLFDDAVGDSNGAAGVIHWVGTSGAWSFDLTGTGSDLLGPNLNATVTSTGAGTLTIWLTQMGNVGSFPSGFWMDFDGTITNGTVTYSAADCFLNGAFHMPGDPPFPASATMIGTLGPFGPGAFSGSTFGQGSVLPTSLYSVTQKIVITASGAVTYSGVAEAQPVPEPGSMLLLGTGLLGVGMAARRARKARA